MIRITVYLKPEAAVALRQIASVKGRTRAAIIRDALDRYMRNEVRPRSKGIGKYRSGEPDVAHRAKQMLASATERGR